MRDTLHTRPKYRGNVVGFRPRDAKGFSEKHGRNVATGNIYKLLALSRYELRDDSRTGSRDFRYDARDDFKYRMRVNIAAMIFVVALAGLAAADVLKLERTQWPPAATMIARSDLS